MLAYLKFAEDLDHEYECQRMVVEERKASAEGHVTVQPIKNPSRFSKSLAQQLARMGRYQDAGRYFQTAAEMAPSNLSALLGLGEVLHKRADYEGSLAVYRRTLALEPQNLSAQLGVARNLALLGRLEEAREALERALPQHPQSASLRFELARVYTRLQEPEQAAEQTRIFQQLREKELAASDAGQSPEPP